ncbi:transcriptional repressor [bacterium]|nr:transcriptional repressor [bacterium]MBU1853673.1 transcriptional repressor [Candidatus Omnitrophota bacterium]
MPMSRGFGPMWWHGRFRGCGYRVTVPREAILDMLSKSDKHLSAEDIYMKVHTRYPAIGLTTIYRTLDILANMGLIFKFDFGDGRARYELVEGPKGKMHHHHLICTSCNRIIDYTDFIDDEVELLKRTEKGLLKKYNFKITNHLIQFYGLCEKCQKKGGD